MAEQDQAAQEQAAQEVEQLQLEDEDNPNYKPPAEKPITDILSQDAEDESLRKYKETLLGKDAGSPVIIDEKNPERVIIQKLSLLPEGRDEMFIDLTKEKDQKDSFHLKEGCKYKIKVYFHVQRDIVTGLRYDHVVSRKGIKVDKMRLMMGSYGPKFEVQTFETPTEDAPSGMLARGDYKIKSKFIDDDKNQYAEWEWHLTIKKDW